jgi:hypothetical protein
MKVIGEVNGEKGMLLAIRKLPGGADRRGALLWTFSDGRGFPASRCLGPPGAVARTGDEGRSPARPHGQGADDVVGTQRAASGLTQVAPSVPDPAERDRPLRSLLWARPAGFVAAVTTADASVRSPAALAA